MPRKHRLIMTAAALGVALCTGSWAYSYPGPDLRNALTASVAPVGFLVAFGVIYSANLLPDRARRFGRAEQPAIGTVFWTFGIATLTVLLTLAYLALPQYGHPLGVAAAGGVGYVLAQVIILVAQFIFAATPEPSPEVPEPAMPDRGLPGAGRVRPSRFSAEPDAPFASDLLGRQRQVENVSALIAGTAGPAMVLVDGAWGTGKTAFLRMCSASLRSRGVEVVEFNAWDSQYTGRPLADLLAVLSRECPKAAAKRFGRLAARVEALFDNPADARVETWHEHERAVRAVTRTVAAVAAELGGLVLVVDELDRCPPRYTLDALAALHHRFSEHGVVVLIAVDRRQLCQSVRAVHGEHYDADGYLRRFADLHIDLPPPTRLGLSTFLEHLLTEAGLLEGDTAPLPIAVRVLRVVAELDGCALRDLQQAAHTYGMALRRSPPDGHPPLVWQAAVAGLVVLRVADRDAYARFVTRDCDGFAALAALYRRLGPEPEYGTDDIPPDHRRDLLAAALLNIEMNTANTDPTVFTERYAPVHAHRSAPRSGDALSATEAASGVLNALYSIRKGYSPGLPWQPLYIEQLAALLDLDLDQTSPASGR